MLETLEQLAFIAPCKTKGTRSTATSLHTEHNMETSPPNSQEPSIETTSNDRQENDRNPIQQQISYPGPAKLSLILSICALSIFLVALDNTIISTAIPRITSEFSSLEDVAWYGSGFFLTMAAFQSLWGKAYKYFGVKSVFLVALFIFGLVGSAICAAAPSSMVLIVGRAIAGFGGAGINSGTYLIVALVAPPAKMPALQGAISASFTIASVAGPLIGGVLTEEATWRWCFWINVPLAGAVMAFVAVFFSTPEHAEPPRTTLKEKMLQMDFTGVALTLGAVVCILLALQWGGVEKAWSSPEVIGLLVGAAAISAVFIVVELRLKERAALSIRLLKMRTIAFVCLHQITLSSCFFVLLYELPIYFQTVSGVNAAQSGIRTIPFIVSSCASAIVAGLFMSATREFQPLLIVGNTMATIGNGLLYTLHAGSPSGQWIGYQILAGFGLGLGVQTAIVVCQTVVETEDLSTVTATILFLQLLAGSVWLAIAQALVNNRLIQQMSRDFGPPRAMEVFAAGGSGLRNVLSAEELQMGIDAYMSALRESYTLCIALSGFATVVVVVMTVFHRRKLGKDDRDRKADATEKST